MTLPTIETPRLRLRALHGGDAAFVLRQLNAPGWLRFIGDRGVHSLADAGQYIESRVIAQYREHGFGMYLVERHDREPIGLCGLVQRDGLPAPDLGFALLEPHWGAGFAFESASAVLEHARRTLGLPRVLAITDPDNARSAALLARLGFRCEGQIVIPPSAQPLLLFSNAMRSPVSA